MNSVRNTVLALLCYGVLANYSTTTPTAGNIGLVLNTTSVENVMTIAMPLACYFALNNKTVELNVSESSSIFYKLTLNSMHINTVTLGKPVFEQGDDANKIHVQLTNIDIDAEVDGMV